MQSGVKRKGDIEDALDGLIPPNVEENFVDWWMATGEHKVDVYRRDDGRVIRLEAVYLGPSRFKTLHRADEV